MEALAFAFYMLVGTYTGGDSEGIYVYGFDPETARTEYVGMVRVDNPSYLAASVDSRTVYAVSENDGESSYANALRFDPLTGELALLDREETGDGPCNIATDGHSVVTANYGGGDLSVFGIEDDGFLSPVVQRLSLIGLNSPKPSHMHCVKFSPDGRYLFATDLGTDMILRYNVDDAGSIDPGSLVAFDVPTGSSPRHFIFDREGRNLYLINEHSGTVIAFRYNGGDLQQFQTVQTDDAGGHGSADIVLTPDGRWLYASNRLKNDGIAVFSVDPGSGALTRAGYRNTGLHPRNLSIAPGGKFLLSANRDGGSVEIFGIDYSDGSLTPVGADIYVSRPVCVVFVAAGR